MVNAPARHDLELRNAWVRDRQRKHQRELAHRAEAAVLPVFRERMCSLGRQEAESVPGVRLSTGPVEAVSAMMCLLPSGAIRASQARPGDARPEEELDNAVRQIISRAVAPEGVIDIRCGRSGEAGHLDPFPTNSWPEVRGLPQKNLAVEPLQKLLKGELVARRRKNVVQARSFAEMLEQTVRRYQNRAIEAAQVIEELIALAKEMRASSARGEVFGLSEDELAFYDALETNDSAVKVLGEETSAPSPRIGRENPHQRHDRLDPA